MRGCYLFYYYYLCGYCAVQEADYWLVKEEVGRARGWIDGSRGGR